MPVLPPCGRPWSLTVSGLLKVVQLPRRQSYVALRLIPLLRTRGVQTSSANLSQVILFFQREQGPREEMQPGRRPGAHKSLGDPLTSKFKIEMSNYAQSFSCYGFIYIVLCILIDWRCCFSRYTMYHHFFWCASGKISIAAVSLLAHCTKYCVSCQNSRKCVLDVT